VAVRKGIVVAGLADLNKAFSVADKETQKEFRQALRAAAEPVKVDAERLARVRIRKIGPDWSRMRVGTTRKSVYVAPKQRSTKDRSRRRKNLFDLLLNQAMEPALDMNVREVEDKVDDALRTVGRKWENA
jgi:hypothetical protein